ncbi:MAG TPA: alpha/beta hydrolase [Chthonomonadaceae bacterium]|nr:alpha/beta hydrolase [Chthonomonadaceae bacterium]
MIDRRTLLAAAAALVLFAARANAQEPTRLKDVVYAHKEGVALTMDVFKPAKPNGIGVLWMVSGGWVSNHDSINPGLAKVFTDRGQTVFEVVHGSQPRYFLPEIVKDIHRAVRFVRTHAAEYGVDPDRLGISGGSAGGHLSLMMGSYGAPGDPKAKDPVDRASSAVQAVACFFPPTDFLNYGADGRISLDDPTLLPFRHVFAVPLLETQEAKVDALRPLSPIYGISKSTPPTLIIHGEADKLVPIQQSERYLAKLQAEGVETKLDRRPGKAHGWPDMGPDLQIIAEWFDSHLAKR